MSSEMPRVALVSTVIMHDQASGSAYLETRGMLDYAICLCSLLEPSGQSSGNSDAVHAIRILLHCGLQIPVPVSVAEPVSDVDEPYNP